MASESKSPWTLGYSGGTVPDSHRIPCLPVVAGRNNRPPAPVAAQIIRGDTSRVKWRALARGAGGNGIARGASLVLTIIL